MQIGTIFEAKANAPHVVISDTEILGSRSRKELPVLTSGVICLGLTSNDLSLAYLNDPRRSLLRIEAVDGDLGFRPKNRGLFLDTPERSFGVCIRTTFTKEVRQSSYIFFCAGIGIRGTIATAQYLANSWPELSRRTGKKDFVAVISVSTNEGRPDLEGVYTA